ncbi:MAG TPA: threonine/serine dehydratase, partial [Planctomycetes bacterium]|nr:threonine/serine dehydratase [Planctomycetota bacterium]
SAATGAEVFYKRENLQVTGSFKARGALHKLLSIDSQSRSAGVVAASSGNHGAAVAWAAARLGCPATVYVPNHASPAKIEAIRSYGARVHLHGADCLESESRAREHGARKGLPYISPYNDIEVMRGQGSVGVELERQLDNLDAVFIALGGGGLIGGVGTYLKETCPETEIIACSPERSPAMHRCLEAGKIIEVPCHDTLSDGTAGGVEAGSVTFEVCQRVVDRSLLVSEKEIRDCTADHIARHHQLIEGAAGVAIAGWRQIASEFAGKRVAIVICGANIGIDTLRKVIG